ncbi:hypothetical protein DSL72_005438 [Monilinia vaccinii-corymbosi]|uniref:Retrotransposon gag domain-containing protein n=1 Tax=Monilinia vaccinii-corymbosi TaxID=61207 RepID=A0A8A3PFN3_9HELO|nr:hypothetical protein DSL72_005438 [Monilinia vaccinii-corymbosi]
MENDLNVVLAEIRTELNRQREEIAFLRSMALERFAAPAHASTRPKPCLPDPEKFGGNTHKFDTWLPSIRAKLQVDGAAIGDSTAQFYYVYLNLESQVQAIVLPQLSLDSAAPLDHNTILDQLSRVYNNPNKVQEAEDRLYALKQGTDSLHTYIAKFERTLYEARGQSWPDSNKISTFRNGLNSTLRNRLSQQLTLPRSYTEFVQVMQQLAARTSMPSGSTPNPTPVQILPRHHSTNHHNPIDVSQINSINVLDVAPDPLPTSPRLEHFVTRIRAPEFTPKERALFRKQNKCVRCGSPHHWVKQCNLSPHSGMVDAPILAGIEFAKTRSLRSSSPSITEEELERIDREGLGTILDGRYLDERIELAAEATDAWHLAETQFESEI